MGLESVYVYYLPCAATERRRERFVRSGKRHVYLPRSLSILPHSHVSRINIWDGREGVVGVARQLRAARGLFFELGMTDNLTFFP
jgi:hypothetical protein